MLKIPKIKTKEKPMQWGLWQWPLSMYLRGQSFLFLFFLLEYEVPLTHLHIQQLTYHLHIADVNKYLQTWPEKQL